MPLGAGNTMKHLTVNDVKALGARLRDTLRNYRLRQLLLLSLAVSLVFPAVLSLAVYPILTDQLVKATEEEALRIGRHLSRLLPEQQPLGDSGFAANVQEILEDFGIRRLKLFDPVGTVRFSTHAEDMGKVNSNSYFHRLVASGQPYSKVVKKEQMTLEGQRIGSDVVETYVPIMRNGHFVGALEIYLDITARRARLDRVVVIATLIPAAVMAAFLLLILSLTLRMEQAERERAKYRGLMEDALQSYKTRNEELNRVLTQLRETESQLIQSEKMASIGNLAAGVAHEINNPVGFVSSNLGTLEEYLANLMDYLNLCERLGAADTVDIPTIHQEMQRLRSSLDVDFIRQDTRQLIHECQDGMRRIAHIVADLKDFAHIDRAEVASVDVASLINKVLTVVNHELKYKAEVHTHYEPTPPLRCYPGRLGQVVLNLLVNAVQAIPERGRIDITVRQEEDRAVIAIRDTGGGMTPEIQRHIFEPFFTTKPVGQGTGLGLHITYQIVTAHGGTVEVESAPGSGTCFTLRLPLAGPPDQIGE